jgi:hypothetical protein
MQGENGTDMDEARCWNGTELQHLATVNLLWMPETAQHKDTSISAASAACISEAHSNTISTRRITH